MDGLLWFVFIVLLGFFLSLATGEYRDWLWLGGGLGFLITVSAIVKDWRIKLHLGLGFIAVIAGLFMVVDFSEWLQLEPYRNENWLVNPNSSYPFFGLVFVYVWSHSGFYMLILLAGLQAISKDYYDAAEIDGTRPTRVFLELAYPCLW